MTSETFKLEGDDRFAHAKEFYTRLGISKSKFYKNVQDGILPKPIKISERASVWPASVIQKTMAAIAEGVLKL